MNDPQKSSYLQYLPPIMWDYEEDPFLGQFLIGMEKILTGFADGREVRIDTTASGERRIRIGRQGDTNPVDIVASRHYESLEAVIDGLHHLFNPRRTRPEFLNYLASWLAFNPGLTQPAFLDGGIGNKAEEARTRSRIARISRIYKLNGLKRGLLLSVDVFTSSRYRPRVAIDDGESLYRLRSGEATDDSPSLTAVAFASSWPYDSDRFGKSRDRKWLLAPRAMAAGLNRSNQPYLIIADSGPAIDPEGIAPETGQPLGDLVAVDRLRPALWRVSLSGEPLDWITSQSQSFPIPLNEGDFSKRKSVDRLLDPTGVVVDQAERVLVLDQGFGELAKPALFICRPAAPLPGNSSNTDDSRRYRMDFLVKRNEFPANVFPLGMTSNPAGNVLFVTGFERKNDDQILSHLLIFKITNPDANPPSVTKSDFTLPGIQRPAAIAFQDDTTAGFTLLIADSRGDSLGNSDSLIAPDPYPDSLQNALAVDLFRVTVPANRSTGSLNPESLLVAPKTPRIPVPNRLNPLVGPTGMITDPKRRSRVLICDIGTKDRENSILSPEGGPGRTDLLLKAEPARIFEIELGSENQQASIRPLTPDPQLVMPNHLVIEPSTGTLFVADEGLGQDRILSDQGLVARDYPHRTRMSLIFSGERPPKKVDIIDQTLADVETVVRAEIPAHVGWNWEFRLDPNPIRPPSTPSL